MVLLPDQWRLEVFKATLTAVVGALTLGLTWLIGNKVAARWAVWQKRRESELVATARFYESYGEFVTVWRLWKCLRREAKFAPHREEERWALLQRACTAEGAVEAICIKLAAERPLDEDQAHAVSFYRKLFHQLRQQIRLDRPLAWTDESEGYKMFKSYAAKVVELLRPSEHPIPSAGEVDRSLLAVTSVRTAQVRYLITGGDRSIHEERPHGP